MFMWSANCIAYHVHAKILYSQDCKLCELLEDSNTKKSDLCSNLEVKIEK